MPPEVFLGLAVLRHFKLINKTRTLSKFTKILYYNKSSCIIFCVKKRSHACTIVFVVFVRFKLIKLFKFCTFTLSLCKYIRVYTCKYISRVRIHQPLVVPVTILET